MSGPGATYPASPWRSTPTRVRSEQEVPHDPVGPSRLAARVELVKPFGLDQAHEHAGTLRLVDQFRIAAAGRSDMTGRPVSATAAYNEGSLADCASPKGFSDAPQEAPVNVTGRPLNR
jgi:hypothetical protein